MLQKYIIRSSRSKKNLISDNIFIVSIIDELMSMVHWWNNTDKRTLKYPEKTLSHCQYVHHKCHIDKPSNKPGP
jgi:hypothetical protein